MKKIAMMMFATMFAMNLLAENVKFKVSNMHCQNCANRVEKALKANKAVSDVKINLECKGVSVSYDATKTNVEALQKALTDVKFDAKVATECDKKEGCKHDGKAGEHKCGKKEKKQNPGEHKCGAEGCGHDKESK
ncbi:heavy-metal-associated domain-containing protein [Prevotella sp. A2931]|uniref:Heavy-metal-associated domain-containing protein n=1 Tax=Prevotella illustrans TaxID=2800387 RepID=A0ABS3M4S7_9BACT|nr:MULTISPECIES: heavy-metal-associated domain-containing protein [Prevotella]MBO1363125.1 heavy-metal-associated domain-containing protein [Prevotella illustrans]PTL26153.1 ATPase P [Prevotella sp. oral taxon 820]